MCHARVLRSPLFRCAVAATLACGRGDKSPAADSAGDSVAASGAAVPWQGEWVTELGRMLLVPADNESLAVVLYPDGAAARSMPSAQVTLLTVSADSATTGVGPIAEDSEECGEAPVVPIEGNVPAAWSVGMVGRSAPALRMDSIEALPPADSARLVVELARLASTLPMDRSSRFTGLPFAVIAAHRFVANGRHVVVAHLVRRIGQEAAPLEERTFIIAERPASAARNARLAVTYSHRSEGSEEATAHFETLLAAQVGQSTLLLLARDHLSRTTYELLERVDGGWRTRWSRTLVC